MKIFNIVNDDDPNDCFEVEAKDECDAAIDALESLGWRVCETIQSEKPNPDQYEFNF